MSFFKNTVALEACPAKTAESVGYGATFAVLGWLLLSNYSGLGQAERDSQPVVSTDSPPAGLPSLAALVETEAPNDPQLAQAALQQQDIETETSNLASSVPTWHAEIEQFRQIKSHPHQRAFSTAAWTSEENDADQQFDHINMGLGLPLPLIESDYLFNAKGNPGIGISAGLASNELDESELVREITVTGSETQRLSRRPDNSQRPQIPRPYSAQQIQRSLVLPPRIQALRP